MGVAGSCDESWAIMALAVGRRFVSLTAIGQSASSQGVKPGGTDQEGLTPVFPYRYFPPPSSQRVGEERQKKKWERWEGMVGGEVHEHEQASKEVAGGSKDQNPCLRHHRQGAHGMKEVYLTVNRA